MIQSKDFLNTLGEISPESPFSPFSPNSPTLWALSGEDNIFSQLKDFVLTLSEISSESLLLQNLPLSPKTPTFCDPSVQQYIHSNVMSNVMSTLLKLPTKFRQICHFHHCPHYWIYRNLQKLNCIIMIAITL